MTDPHPLTDKMIEKLSYVDVWWSDEFGPNNEDLEDYRLIMGMRAAYDLAIEHVKKKVESKLLVWRKWDNFDEQCDEIENFFHYIMQELRPQQQEES